MKERLIEEWVDVASDRGQRLVACPDACFALYDSKDHPPFDPVRWNTAQKGANCLGYALQAPSESLAPGFVIKGKDPEKYHLADVFNRAFARSATVSMDDFRGAVKRGLEKDGMLQVGKDELYRPGHYLIALCFTEIPDCNIKDFHFLVLNANGRWSEMNGETAYVSWTDRHDEPILNPAAAFLGQHTIFDSFYAVPKGGAQALRQIGPAA